MFLDSKSKAATPSGFRWALPLSKVMEIVLPHRLPPETKAQEFLDAMPDWAGIATWEEHWLRKMPYQKGGEAKPTT